jgi:aryl sulfotransferase
VRRYRSEANGRWAGFVHRDGDIVVSTRTKCGTTWMQMICLLLVHQTADLPAPLGELSPWLDHDVEPIEAVRARLAAQPHRRVIKTHTPLDGLPLDDRVTYIVVARHPLDVAVSLFHHSRNIDRARMQELTGRPSTTPAVPTPEAWIEVWITDRRDPAHDLDSLAGNLHHVVDAWDRRGAGAGNVVLAHYADLEADLGGAMRALADRLGIAVAADRWPALVDAAGFAAMRARAPDLAPDRLGVLRDTRAFFRTGGSGEGVRLATADQRARYGARVRELAAPDVVAWLNRPG